MNSGILFFFALILLAGCLPKATKENADTIVSMQLVDRNGFSDTISNKDRLSSYQKVDFLSPQPFEKVLRVYGRGKAGKSSSKITSYHKNGQVAQYLEIVDGRAHGTYLEWHENGTLRVEAHVIEGTADISEVAKASWLFDGKSRVWDERGHLTAEISYDKGGLETPSLYYYPEGALKQVVPYHRNAIHGSLISYSPTGAVLEKTEYCQGLKQGLSVGFWEMGVPKFQELYSQDLLQEGFYYTPEGKTIGGITAGEGTQALFEGETLAMRVEYHHGVPEGKVEMFRLDSSVLCIYHIKEGKKEGLEEEYYPTSEKKPRPKLQLHWHEDAIQGQVKTWYDGGGLESQREIHNNKKQGMSFAWYKSGDLMLSEEYDNDLLLKGSYYKPGSKNPISRVEGGKGTATLYSPEGIFLKKIPYDKGKPLVDDQ